MKRISWGSSEYTAKERGSFKTDMQRQRRIFWAKTGVILAAVPFLMWAYEYGPNPGYSGVPKENGTCLQAGCHVGTLNGSTGSLSVTFPGGMTYTPGVKQHLIVTVSDSDTTQKAWGFQLTPRLASNSATMAGSVASTDANTLLMCSDANLFSAVTQNYNGQPQTCPSTAKPALTLQYIEHSLQGYQANLNKTGGTYEFDWTPPATDQGSVIIYIAANAGPGGAPNQNNAHIYTKTYTLTSAAASPTPAVTKVVSASGFGGFSTITPGTYIEITGTNLASNTRIWAGTDFNGVNAPQSLDNTSVSIGGQSAFVYYISPTQVNALVPSGVVNGSQQLTVTAGGVTSAAFTVTVASLEPGLLALPQTPWLNGTKQYVVAQTTDNAFVLPAGTTISGYTVRPAKPGETLTIYGIGFGAVTPTIAFGQIATQLNSLTNPVTMQVNGSTATLSYQGLAPNFVGLYQFNVVVPAVADGDWPLTFTQAGNKGTQTLLLSVHQ
jgi:uncharacterized protein (TIGR03437 family)